MNDYMSRMEELEKHPHAHKMFKDIAAGNEHVYNFLWAMWNFEHAFDDLIDIGPPKDDQSKELVFKALAKFIDCLLTNPFVKTYADDLRAMMISTMTRCLDGDKAEAKGDPKAPAIRCGDVDLVMHVAYLHRGWDYMRSLNALRIYDKPDKELTK